MAFRHKRMLYPLELDIDIVPLKATGSRHRTNQAAQMLFIDQGSFSNETHSTSRATKTLFYLVLGHQNRFDKLASSRFQNAASLSLHNYLNRLQ